MKMKTKTKTKTKLRMKTKEESAALFTAKFFGAMTPIERAQFDLARASRNPLSPAVKAEAIYRKARLAVKEAALQGNPEELARCQAALTVATRHFTFLLNFI